MIDIWPPGATKGPLVKLTNPDKVLYPATDGVGPTTKADVFGYYTSIAEVMVRKVSTIAPHAPASELPRIFERGEVALVVDDARTVLGIVTKLDMIEHLTKRPGV